MVRLIHKLLAGIALTVLFTLVACAESAPSPAESPAPPASTPANTEVPDEQEATATIAPEPTPTESAPGSSSEVSFSRDVLPVLQSRCINCHGGQRTAEGLDMKTYEAIMAGSQNGSVVTPGDAANSSFVTLAEQGKMPKRGPKLTPAEVQLLRDWVNAGAPNN